MVDNISHLKISILLPTHNRADVLAFAIESALYQTEQNFELLIVGDGCTDDTDKIVSKYAQDKRIKWFDLPKGRFFGYDNRNIVLKQARGEYISFLAHDDIITPEHLALLSSHLDKHDNIDIVYSRSFWIDDHGALFPSVTNLDDKESLDSFFDRWNTIPASCFMHRRSVFEKIGYWDETLEQAADWDLWKKIIDRGNPNFVFESTITVFHFKAIWKSIDQTWPKDIDLIIQYMYLKENKDSLIPLCIPKKTGISLQQSLFDCIKTDRMYVDTLRRSATALLDHIVNHRFSNAMMQKELLAQEIEQIKQEMERIKAEIEKNKEMGKIKQEIAIISKLKKFFL